MKKIAAMIIGVLACTLVFASGKPETSKKSQTAVTRARGSSIVKVYYKTDERGSVKVSIVDKLGKELFAEQFTKADGFVRPYNLESLPYGEYQVNIEDGDGKIQETVSYSNDKPQSTVHVERIAGAGNKYLVNLTPAAADQFTISIYNSEGDVIYRDVKTTGDAVAQVYDLSKVSNFTLEVKDSSGIIKSVSY